MIMKINKYYNDCVILEDFKFIKTTQKVFENLIFVKRKNEISFDFSITNFIFISKAK